MNFVCLFGAGKVTDFSTGHFETSYAFWSLKNKFDSQGGYNFLRSFRVSNSNRTHGSIKAVKEEGITDADKLFDLPGCFDILSGIIPVAAGFISCRMYVASLFIAFKGLP